MIKKKGYRLLSTVLSTSMILGLFSGCGSEKTTEAVSDTETVTEAVTEAAVQSPTDVTDDNNWVGIDTFTDTIELADSEYDYDSEEIMYLSGVKLAAYRENMKYSLSDLDEDGVSELFVSEKEGNDEKVAVYVFDQKSNAAKRECIYDVISKQYIEQPGDELKGKVDSVRNNPESINWVGSDQWVDGSIYGVAKEIENPGIKTDYYLSVNYDWLSEQHIAGQGDSVSDVNLEKSVDKKKEEMLFDREKYQGEDVQRLRDYYDIATDWDKRNKEGIEPVIKYIDAVKDISSIDDLTAYLIDHDRNPFCNFMTFDFTVDLTDTSHWVVEISEDNFSVLPRIYHNEDEESIADVRRDFISAAECILGKAGYSDTETKKLIEDSLRIENRLNDKAWPTGEEEKDELYGYLPIDTFDAACDNFPFKELLASYNITEGKAKLLFPDYLRELDSLYTEENLEALKAYILTHMAYKTYEYLDFDTANCQAIQTASQNDAELQKDRYNELNDNIRTDVLSPRGLLSVAEENAYMTFFVDPDAKKELLELSDEIKSTYREMLLNEDWISEEGKNKSLEKLDNLTFSVLSPDTLIDSSYLAVDPDMSYLDAYARLLVNTYKHNGEFVGEERVPGEWRYDLRQHIATTYSNAYYFGSFNQFFIMAGFIDDVTYSKDMSREEKLGRIGETIGHELTHAFDPMGISYDKDGNLVGTDDNPCGWLPKEDYDAFMERSNKVADYYTNIYPFPYECSDGQRQWGEAVADMGGLEIGLKIAEKEDNFDYDLFFRSHADLWKRQSSLIFERSDIHDEHPLCHLRINSVYQQCEEFYEIYDIKEGDLMYLAPEDRISIW